MNIAFFSDNFYPELGGIQDSLWTTAKALADRGHSIAFVVPSFSKRDCTIGNVPFSERPPYKNIEIHRVASMHVKSSTLQSRLVIPTGTRWKKLKKFRPHLIHTHTFFGMGIEAIIAARKLNIPLIGTNHTAVSAFSDYSPLKKSWFVSAATRFVAWYYNHCDVVTAPSHSVLTEMIDAGLRAPHHVVSNPIDTALFSPAPSASAPALKQSLGFSDHVICYAGRLAPEKNIDVIVGAVALLAKKIPTVTLALAGHGSSRGDLEKLSRELGIASNVRFLGTLPQLALVDLFRASDVFAIASTSETQSMTLLQAMSCRLPAVGVDALALPEYIDNGQTGCVVPSGDSQAMASALEDLLINPAKRIAFGERASMKVREQYGREAVTDVWEKIYGGFMRS